MTKVKTILAEFCSPKDILAINRLGLLKKEERESQPIPWRHRLSNAERRELVKSEMRMSIRPSRSRVSSRDKDKAFQSAANPVQSRMGECLYSIHLREDPLLGSSLVGLEREQSRLEACQNYSRQEFVSRSYSFNHEPLLLVEREPSQMVKTRAMLMRQHGIDPQNLLRPSYMRPLEYQAVAPSTITTIDAFVAESKKKRNVWEKVLDDAEPTKFRSAAHPSTRLSEGELQQLRVGHAFHKPRPGSANRLALAAEAQKAKQKRPARASRSVEDSVFITQRFTTDDAEARQASSDETSLPTRTIEQHLSRDSQEKAELKSKPTRSKSSSGGGGSKTVTFTGVPTDLPDFATKKNPRPRSVATEMVKSHTVHKAESARPKSECTQSIAREDLQISATLTKPSSKSDSGKRRSYKGDAAQDKHGKPRKMNFLNTLLEVP